jgi:acyl carrier protein
MDNLGLYKQAFIETFSVEEKDVEALEYQSINEWDSVGHMMLMAALEEAFDIMMDIDDIIDFASFEKGKEILAKYDVVI